MIPKKTEDTITVMLKNELEKRGVKAEAFPELRTPVGYRKPDLYCQNGGAYIIEAKFKEGDLWKAVAKVQNDYIKYHGILRVSGGFAIIYPEELAKPLTMEVIQELAKKMKFKIVMLFLPEDTRKNFHVVEGTVEEIADELAKQILTPPEFVEPSVELIIGTLRDIAHAITAGLKYLSGKQLEDLFGGKHVFENILQYEESKYPEDDLRLASAYLLVNQLLFYNVLSRRMPKRFSELDPDHVTSPSTLQNYFSKVLDVNYRAIFSYDVASRIPLNFTNQVKDMIAAIQGLSAEKVGGDLLGTIFHDLIPFDVRKKVAAFYTNVFAAEILASLAIDKWDSKVADFACGSGGLLVAAYRRKRRLLEKVKPFRTEEHRRFIEQDLLGVDVMPFAANVAASHLALQSPELFTNRVQIAIWDSTELSPKTKIPSIAHLRFVVKGQQTLHPFFEQKRQTKKGLVMLGKEVPEEIELEYYDVVIMNPPFTRQERIPREYKDVLFERFKEYSKYLHGQMGYYGYFILLADKFLKEGGRLAFVLPAAFLRTKSVEQIRKILSEKYNIECVITGKGRLNFSEATWRREVLFVARKLREGETKANSLFVALTRLPENLPDIVRLVTRIKQTKGEYEDKEIKILSVQHKELEEDLDWFRFIVSFGEIGVSELWERISSEAENLVKLGDLYDLSSSFREGIESRKGMKLQAVLIPSSQERAIRTEDLWILDRIQEEHVTVRNRNLPTFTVRIPKDCVAPALRTIAGNSTMDLSDKTDFVVIKDFPESQTFFIGDRKSLVEVLPNWMKYVKDRAGNLLILRRFPINAPGTVHLCYYSQTPVAGPGTTWVVKIPDEEAKILSLWFNSSLHLAQVFRERIEDVWLDIHKYILKDMLVLNPRTLSKKKKRKLVELFDAIKQEPFPNLEEQYTNSFELKRKIDIGILEATGFYEKTESILEQIHEAIRMQFDTLKKLSK